MAQELADTKQCRACFQEIDRRAKACPHCGHWQWRTQIMVILPIVVAGVALITYGEWLERRFSPRRMSQQSVTYRGQIAVTHSEMFKGSSADGEVVYIVGKLRNESDVEWREVGVEAQFFDPQGRRIDVGVEDYFLEHLVPQGEMAFKIRAVADRPVEDYADYKVSVQYAKDARRDLW